MTMKSIGLYVLAIAAGVFLAASPAMGQSCPKQSATGHVEFIGTVPGVNPGRDQQTRPAPAPMKASD